jgi:peptide/nickel transport system substrate-binding protein
MKTSVVRFLALLLALAVLLSACGQPTATPVPTKPPAAGQPTAAPTKAPEPTKAPASKYKEAPILADLVKAGKLPSVDQRLPANPLVYAGASVGTYGGNWRMGMRGSDYNMLFKTFGVDNLVTWTPDGKGIVPNLAEKYEVSADGTEFTFYLRKGLKWSDGQPYTAADIEWWWAEVAQNKDLEPAGFPSIQVKGEFGKFTKVDDYTFKVKFAAPYAYFLQQIAAPVGAYVSSCPAHFAKQYHVNFADKAKLDQMVKDGGFKTWAELFNARLGAHCQSVWSDENRPNIYAWVVDKGYSPNATQLTFSRNPYYWKVDSAGNQYPYIDKITVDVVQDVSALVLKATNGEIDYQARSFNTDPNKPVLFDNQKKGDYRLVSLIKGQSNTVAIHFNMTSKDAVKRAVFQIKDFRIAMSYAINRQEMIDTIFVSQGKAAQPAPLEGTAFYNKQLATQYTEYDVKKANELLDKIGMKKGADGWRTTPDGKPFAFILEGTKELSGYMADAGNMLAKYWKAVGINAEYKDEARDLLYQRKDNNDTDATLWGGEGGLNPLLDVRNFAPVHYESNWAVAWKNWYTKTKENAEEPPANIKALIQKYDDALLAPSYDAQVKAVNEMLQMAADLFPNIGISTPADGYGVAKNNLKNVPDRMITDFTYTDPFIARPYAWYFGK